MLHISRHVRAALTGVAVLSGALIASPATAHSMEAGPGRTVAPSATAHADASRHSCKGLHIDRTAPVISTGDIKIRASLKTIYALQTDVNNWPTWRPDVAFATRLEPGAFRAGSSFRWQTYGITVVSTVKAVHRNHCTFWGGPASGIQGEHLWRYTKVRGGVLVHTEESWSGPPVDANVAGLQAALDNSLEMWRADLKATAEALDNRDD